jgi:hypothetical protein
MPRRRTLLFLGVVAVAASVTVVSLSGAGAQTTGFTTRGVIGADVTGIAIPGGDDWGALSSLNGRVALTSIRDADVAVVDNQAPSGVTSGDEGDSTCTGGVFNPTAPPDVVCVYISNGDNAVDVRGVSVLPGTANGSKFGFKIVWSTPNDDADSFVEATWAYQRPSS